MPSTTCAYCGRLTHMTHRFSNSYRIQNGTVYLQGAFSCDNCSRLSVAARKQGSDTSIESVGSESQLAWQPRAAVSPEFPDVPKHIARAAKEAHESHSISALMAAILMARTVVEATAKEKGITKGTLVAKIDDMQKADLIRKPTAEAAHEIRHFGNDMAHGDIADLPSAEDAAEVLELMDEVLNEVFQGPARTQRIKDKRAAAASGG